MKAVNSIWEERVLDLISIIKQELAALPQPTLEEIEDTLCTFDPAYRSFDLAKLYWFLNEDPQEFCGSIRGGIEYLEHVPQCKGCLRGLKVDERELGESKWSKIADGIAKKWLPPQMVYRRGSFN